MRIRMVGVGKQQERNYQSLQKNLISDIVPLIALIYTSRTEMRTLCWHYRKRKYHWEKELIPIPMYV